MSKENYIYFNIGDCEISVRVITKKQKNNDELVNLAKRSILKELKININDFEYSLDSYEV